jgi:hypothetical protein
MPIQTAILESTKFSGDGECFAFKVDFETFKKLNPHWEFEEELVRENYENIDKEYNPNSIEWLIYPGQLFETDKRQKYKVTITVEEITNAK